MYLETLLFQEWVNCACLNESVVDSLDLLQTNCKELCNDYHRCGSKDGHFSTYKAERILIGKRIFWSPAVACLPFQVIDWVQAARVCIGRVSDALSYLPKVKFPMRLFCRSFMNMRCNMYLIVQVRLIRIEWNSVTAISACCACYIWWQGKSSIRIS